MFDAFRNAWKIPDLRKKIFFTLFMLVVFRLGVAIPVPGINRTLLESMIGTLGQFGDIISGGALKKASIFAMSITPYINASIIINLLTIAIPSLERLAKEGEEGKKVIAMYTRVGTIFLGFIQATGLYLGFKNAIISPGVLSFLVVTLSLTAGTALLMWIGEKITENGVGNGISLIIFAGIVGRIPSAGKSLWMNYHASFTGYLTLIAILIVIVIVIAGVVLINQGERRIAVQYAKRVVGNKMYGGQNTHIPIKINMAGVIPIIFAMSITSFPQIISSLMGVKGSWSGNLWQKFIYLFSSDGWPKNTGILYNLIYVLLIIFFTYFYTIIMFNPVDVANNMKKNGGFIPGIRPGKATADFLTRVVNRTTLVGGLFLAIVALLPVIINIWLKLPGFWFGGTALLIVVGVAIETNNQIQSQMLVRHYKGFLQ